MSKIIYRNVIVFARNKKATTIDLKIVVAFVIVHNFKSSWHAGKETKP